MCSTTINPEQVIEIVCQFYELDVDKMIKRIPETGRHYRAKEYVKGRQFVHYWMFKNTTMTLKRIGSFMEDIHYSTVLHSIATVEDEMNLYGKYKSEIFKLNQLIQKKESELEKVYV